jgi:predicted DNA-binding transcriptional regulator YafY
VHDEAPAASETDWPQILALDEVLSQVAPGPVVTLSRAVALAMVHDPKAGLALLGELDADDRMTHTHRRDAVRAHLLERAGDTVAARESYLRAARMTVSAPEQRYLALRAARPRQPGAPWQLTPPHASAFPADRARAPARPAEFVGTRSYGRNVNRTDRLYALVEELRACAPRRRSARELASLYEVSARTIERDIGALQQAGVPIYADAGRSGGYTVDKSLTLPPLNFSPAEAVALAVALGRVSVGPFEGAARSAVRKIVAAMSEPNVIAARDLAGRVRLLEPVAVPETVAVPSVIEQAIVARRVLWICYLDREGNLTERDVEPIVFMAGPGGWYLVGWCRVRGAARCFRVDRIQQAEVTGVTAPPRAFEEIAPCTPDLVARAPVL